MAKHPLKVYKGVAQQIIEIQREDENRQTLTCQETAIRGIA